MSVTIQRSFSTKLTRGGKKEGGGLLQNVICLSGMQKYCQVFIHNFTSRHHTTVSRRTEWTTHFAARSIGFLTQHLKSCHNRRNNSNGVFGIIKITKSWARSKISLIGFRDPTNVFQSHILYNEDTFCDVIKLRIAFLFKSKGIHLCFLFSLPPSSLDLFSPLRTWKLFSFESISPSKPITQYYQHPLPFSFLYLVPYYVISL